MIIEFRSDGVGNAAGFQAQFLTGKLNKCFPFSKKHRTLLNAECGGEIETYGQNGTFQSPGFPNATGAPKECKYYLKIHPHHEVNVEFTTLEMNDPNCRKNFLMVGIVHRNILEQTSRYSTQDHSNSIDANS